MLERELSLGLRPVAAPADLWGHVGQVVNLRPIGNRPSPVFAEASSRPIDNRPQVNNLPYMAVAVAAIVVMLWGVQAESGAKQMRQWVAANSGLNVRLAERPGLRLAAAHVERDRAEVAFSVDGRMGRLVVAKTSSPARGETHALPASGAAAYSWAQGGLQFTLDCASPEDLRMACQLCHG